MEHPDEVTEDGGAEAGTRSLTRRSLLTGIAGAAAALAASSVGVAHPGAPAPARDAATTQHQRRPRGDRWDVLVIGAGVFGAWTAWNLLRNGKKVLLIDARGPANAS